MLWVSSELGQMPVASEGRRFQVLGTMHLVPPRGEGGPPSWG